MGQRGRKSAASNDVAVLIGADTPRINSPEKLTYEQAGVFAEIVESLPGKFFEQSQAPLVCALARHVVSARRLSRWIDKLETPVGGEIEPAEYIRALEARRKESAAIVSIARALRITNQSRYRPGQAGREAENRPRPWEGWCDDAKAQP